MTLARSRSSQRQVLVVLWVATLPHSFRWFKSLSGDNRDVKDTLAALDSNEAIELRAENDFAIFVFDCLREKEPVRGAHGAEQRLFRKAIRF